MSVFISYSHEDSAFVDRLALVLIERHVTVWKDQWKLLAGDSLTRQIDSGIHGAAYFCLALSRHALDSAWVDKELRAALATEAVRNGLVILPLLLDDSTLPAAIADKVAVDFRGGFEDGLRQLMAVVGPRYSVDATGRFRDAGSDAPYFTDFAFDEALRDDRYVLQLDVVSIDLESQHSVLSQFVFSAASTDAPKRLELAAGERLRDKLVLACAESFATDRALVKLVPGSPQRARFTIADSDGAPCFEVSVRVAWLGKWSRGAQVFDLGGLFDQIRARQEPSSSSAREAAP